MLFNSLGFALFLPVVFLIYWLLRRQMRWQNLFVLAASWFFYGCWNPLFLLLIAFTSAASYLSGYGIGRCQGMSKKWVMWGNVVVNLLVLGVFKYYDFFVQSFADLFLGGHADGLLLRLVLPVGISFYTFQALSYSIDVYHGTVKPTRDVVAFFAYVSFFPQLVAGPIERASSLLPQFERPRRFEYALAVDGLRQMLWGFFKKMVVADTCALYVDRVFGDMYAYSGGTLAIAAVLFSVQIYGDFSGYSDIAIGTAKLFGIRLRRNFNVPYFSRDIAEFWRRWHISLTSWFRDYVYIPLGGSKVGLARLILNIFVIFLLSGFWHGANWTFLFWGVYHALLFLPLILLGLNRRHRDMVMLSWKSTAQMILTFLVATVGWVIFRADSMHYAIEYLYRIPSTFFSSKFETLLQPDYWILLLSIPLLFLVEWRNRNADHEFVLQPCSKGWRWMGYIFLIFLIICFLQTAEMPFIYFQF